MLRLIDAIETAIGPLFAAAILAFPVEAGLLVLAPAAVVTVATLGAARRLWQTA